MSGFPGGKAGDVYDAITSNRPYKAGRDPGESMRRMSGWCKDHLDEPVFHAFVRSIGIYPVGSLVRLSSQRLAVVVEMGAQSLLTPKVRLVLSVRSRERLAPELIDLAAKSVNEKIIGVENPQQWQLTGLEMLWAG